MLLGEIHQLEVDGERSDHRLRALRGQGLQEGEELLRRAEPTALRTAAALDGEQADALLQLQEVCAFLLRQHLTEEAAEAPDLGAEGRGGALWVGHVRDVKHAGREEEAQGHLSAGPTRLASGGPLHLPDPRG